MNRILISIFMILFFCFAVNAESITPGHLLISSDSTVYEYTLDGNYVQSFSVDYPDGYPSTEYPRDIAADVNGNVYIYNGTFYPYMSDYDSGSGLWNHLTSIGFSTVNNGSYGGIDFYGTTVFCTDMLTYGGGEGQGIVAFDTSTGEAFRFAEDTQPIDLTIGLNGLLYTLSPGGSPGGRNITIYNPITFEYVDSVDLTAIFGWTEHRSIAVDKNGDIFIADWDGEVHHLSQEGELIETIRPTCDWIGHDIQCEFCDIDISENGIIALGTRFGEIIITDTSFSEISTFDVGTSVTFVEFAHTEPVPSNLLPQASFTYFCSDLACSFTDTSTDADGFISSWVWNFGDGQTSNEQNPTHEYSAAGSYTVTLTVFDDFGAGVDVTQMVVVNDRLHISDIMLNRRDGTKGNKYAQAWVYVVDSFGSPVSGATVSGSFSGDINSESSAVTRSDGMAYIESEPIKGRTHFTFCVSDVVVPGYTYDADANVKTCDAFK